MQQQSTDKKPESDQPQSAGKKRKAQDSPPADDQKENVESGEHEKKATFKAEQREHTPGRDGPIKEEVRGLSPKIKPFKGEKGHKVRKSFREKEDELHLCFEKGPKGSPTYDKSGFQLDYQKVKQWMEPQAYNKSAMVKGMDNAVNKAQEEKKKMAAIFFEPGEAPADSEYCRESGYWKDRVSKDLNVPWHKIEVKHFEQWEKSGFKKAKRNDYKNPLPAESERMTRLLSLRK